MPPSSVAGLVPPHLGTAGLKGGVRPLPRGRRMNWGEHGNTKKKNKKTNGVRLQSLSVFWDEFGWSQELRRRAFGNSSSQSEGGS